MSKNYNMFDENTYAFLPNKDQYESAISPGMYNFSFQPGPNGQAIPIFSKFTPKHDDILDLPSPEFVKLLKDLEKFMMPETKQRFLDLGFLYKRSALLHGVPGTGKTCLVNRYARDVIDKGGIVLFNPKLELLPTCYKILDKTNPNTMVTVIFEEFEQYHDTPQLLSILDGEIQKDNIMYIATTNYIDRIPGRLLRPGRFASIIEVFPPQAEARRAYLQSKFKNKLDNIEEWVEKTDGFTIDELKEAVLAVECLDQSFEEVVERIGVQSTINKNLPKSSNDACMPDFSIHLNQLKELQYSMTPLTEAEDDEVVVSGLEELD